MAGYRVNLPVHLGLHSVIAIQNLCLNCGLRLGLKQNTYIFLYNKILKTHLCHVFNSSLLGQNTALDFKQLHNRHLNKDYSDWYLGQP
jgi:hypothetical protein